MAKPKKTPKSSESPTFVKVPYLDARGRLGFAQVPAEHAKDWQPKVGQRVSPEEAAGIRATR